MKSYLHLKNGRNFITTSEDGKYNMIPWETFSTDSMPTYHALFLLLTSVLILSFSIVNNLL